MKRWNCVLALLLLFALLFSAAACREKPAEEDVSSPAQDVGIPAPGSTAAPQADPSPAQSEEAASPAAESDQQEPEQEAEKIPTRVTVLLEEPLLPRLTEAPGPAEKMLYNALFLPGQALVDGEMTSDVILSRERIGGYVWRLGIAPGIRDTLGNDFTAADAAACLTRAGIAAEALDEATVELRFAPDSSLDLDMLLCGTWFYTEASRIAAEGSGLPASTGAYSVAEFSEDHILLTRSENPWFAAVEGCSPLLDARADEIELRFEPSRYQRFLLAKKGQYDVIMNLDRSYQRMLTGYDRSETLPGDYCYALFFNMDRTREPFKRPLLRQAIATALLPEALLADDDVCGTGTAGILPFGTPGASGSQGTEQDLDRAEQLFRSSKFQGKKLILLVPYGQEEAAQLILEQCGAIGLKVELKYADDVKEEALAGQTDWDMALYPVQNAGNAALSYARAFQREENGLTWFALGDEGVLATAELMGTPGGAVPANVTLFDHWLRETRTVVGYYTPGTEYLLVQGLGPHSCAQGLPILGSISPRENAPAEG